MTNKEIFDFYIGVGLTPEGACALMGNMKAESSMIPNIAQRGMTKLTDAQYTYAADSGSIDFANDRIGYGYFQHTYPSRKANLLKYAKEFGVSVGNAMMQLNFSVHEMRSEYPGVWRELTTSRDLFACTQLVCNVYENPAVKNVGTRYEYAQQFYAEFVTGKPASQPINQPVQKKSFNNSIARIQLVMNDNGYWNGEVDGKKSNEFFDKLEEFVLDMKSC